MNVGWIYRLCVLGAALLFSTGGAAIKGCQLSGWGVASFRSAMAAFTLALLLPATRRGWTWRTGLVGISYAATMILFVLANKLTTAANTIFLQSTAPLYILLLAPLLLRERSRAADVVAMVAMAAGLMLFFWEIEPARASAPRPLLGNLLAAAAGCSWGLTLMGLRWLGRAAPATQAAAEGPPRQAAGLAAVVAGNVLAFAIALPWALDETGPSAITAARAEDWGLIVYLGVVQIGLAYVLLTRGFRHVPALEASLLILVEPTFNPLWAWLFQDEVPGRWAIAGGALILCASLLRTWWAQRHGDTDTAAGSGAQAQAPPGEPTG